MKGYGHKRRLVILAGLLGVAFAGLSARLVVLQVCDHDKYRAVAERKQVFLKEPRRGEILDANGNPLAISVPVKKVFANPKFIGGQYGEVAHGLAPLLGMNEPELARKLQPTVSRTNEFGMPVTNSYVNLKKKVTIEQWQQITQAMMGLTFAAEAGPLTKTQKRFYRTLKQKAIYAEDDQQRTYPGGRLASHVLGFVQDDEFEFNDTHLIEMSGKYGIERWFNNQLRGVRGWRISETDHKRREIVVYRQQEVEPRPGLNVVLTLDMVAQTILETALAEAVHKHNPKSASGMVVRPATGEILALAVLPDFNPADPGGATPDQMRNRIVADSYEPGSVFKIVAISAALNENVVTLSDMIDCENGLWHYAGKPLKDHGHYGVMPVEMVVGKSSNIGTAKIGLMLGEERLYKYLLGYGFGARTGITLDGEVAPALRPPRQWDKLKITRIPIGQGVPVTHMQMMMAMCAVANKGRLMRPMLVSRLEDQTGQVFAQYHAQMVRQVISEHAAQLTVTALKNVVSTNGTAKAARLDHYTVAGKTGTAEKPLNGVYTDEYVASFFGFFPADNPQVCISVVLDEPEKDKGYFGGATAAPIFKSIAEQTAKYLKIRPDPDDAADGPMW